ncbi:TPA: primosomal protein N' [Candidatus Scatousia excrementigallinarum]|uniref:Replication restart protein PriA n=1 Tax=Candidatus Scatousia excrementigallinarum TaxID=2840935 RepID=A0A9D1JNM5_9BACT|nr:primosomal protein N' [Candidatus Scatousia excrementigallinarum]
MKYALALVNIKGLGVKTFSYLIPDEMKDKIQIGQAILVPFGRQGLINAFCVGFSDYLPEEIKAKKISKILDETPLFSIDYLKLLEWVGNYYCCDLVTVLNAAIPLKLIEKVSKTEQSVEFTSFEGATKRQVEVLEKLKDSGKMPLVMFEKYAKTTRATIKKLEAAGCLKLSTEEIYRNPLDILKIENTEPLSTLEGEQLSAYEGISKKIKENSSAQMLLYGVTASGKTEVYFKLIDDTIKSGKNVLFLAPEIALASQLTKRLAKKFGTKDVAIWHSSISDGERYDVWQRLYKDDIKILAGARSAVFAPLKNIGLIIIDEEHEGAYKQTSPAPRYDAKVVAQKLSEFHQCPLLLGSATPDISVYYRAVNSGNLFEMKHRYRNAPIAPVTVINMQEHSKAAYRNVISKPLQTAINETLEKKQQVILLINRRGFSTYTQCQACGHVIECPNCAIPMIWHAKDQRLKCHYCNQVERFPDVCPECGSDALRNSGTGTQKIEQYIKELFPEHNVERVDSDVMARKGEHIRLLERFQKGDIDILVGTQMIAKGLDNPNVTLVGVISADASFNLPDFRASERGFQLLTQVAGRAGRGEFTGRVFFQTYNPDYYALASAKSQNYGEFYTTEIAAREEFDYPPFSQMIRLIISSINNFRAEKSAQEITLRMCMMIEKYGISERLEVLGPTPCVIERINGYYRFQIIIKNKLEEKGHNFISSFLNKITMPKDIKLAIDVDPLDIL